MLIQPTLLVAVHGQPLPALTPTLPLPPAGKALALLEEIDIGQATLGVTQIFALRAETLPAISQAAME
jgi:hypothetical protein